MGIELLNVAKRYRFEWIFRNINYKFHSESSYAISGPNGAGKSTFLKILSGHLSPSKGKIVFSKNGNPIEQDLVYRQVSYAAPYIDLIEELTLIEAIEFHKKFKPFLNNLQTKDVEELLHFSKSSHKEVKYFSSGMKQRLKLVLAICSDTDILLLDEPTTNLDKQGINWYLDLINKFRKDRLVIIASNVETDFSFCEKQLNIQDYKTN
jgi:ABC-type multidrug transport system ATPase subunit